MVCVSKIFMCHAFELSAKEEAQLFLDNLGCGDVLETVLTALLEM